MGRVVLAGGSGFLGEVLAGHFGRQGAEVVILSRHVPPFPTRALHHSWDGRTVGEWATALDGAGVLINLAGRTVNCRYHARNRREMMESRTASTRVLGEAIRRCSRPPRVWINSSTATIYQHSLDQPMDESGRIAATPEAKDAFSIEVAEAWEREFRQAHVPLTRKVLIRTAMVLGLGANSVFPTLRRLVRLGLGGTMASGRQYVSWIHEADFCRALDWIFTHEELEGPVNLAAPNPLPNREMMRVLREACGAPFGLPASAWMLEAGAFLLRTETELIIKSRRVVPGRLAAGGFAFQFPTFAGAVQELLSRAADR